MENLQFKWKIGLVETTWSSLLPPVLLRRHHLKRPARWLSDFSAGLVPSTDRSHEHCPLTLSTDSRLGEWKADTPNLSCTSRAHSWNHPRAHWIQPIFAITPSFILTFRKLDLPSLLLRLLTQNLRNFLSSRSTSIMIKCFSLIGSLGEQPILLPPWFSNTGDTFLKVTRGNIFLT